MSDFQTADIGELLHEAPPEKKTEDERALEALKKQDAALLSGFSTRVKRFQWPDPVRKKHIR